MEVPQDPGILRACDVAESARIAQSDCRIIEAHVVEHVERLYTELVVLAFTSNTVGSAYAEFAEKVKGSITPGKLADLVMLDRDIYKIDPLEIDKTKVLLTIMDGKIIYEGASK